MMMLSVFQYELQITICLLQGEGYHLQRIRSEGQLRIRIHPDNGANQFVVLFGTTSETWLMLSQVDHLF